MYRRMDHPLFSMTSNELLEPHKVEAYAGGKWYNPVVTHECPFCGSDNLKDRGGSSTCVAHYPIDRNHRKNALHCLDCDQKFVHHTHGTNHWYAVNNETEAGHWSKIERKTVKGIASCCPGKHPCKCGGWISYKHDSDDGSGIITMSIGGPKQKEWSLSCDSCGATARVESEWHASLEDPYKYCGIPKPEPREGPFKIQRNFGVSVFNANAISKIKFE